MSSIARQAWRKRWLKPEVFPLVGFIGSAVGLASFMVIRMFTIDPAIKWDKDNRSFGVPQNWKEGRMFHEHRFRKFLSSRKTQITPRVNDFLSKLTKSPAKPAVAESPKDQTRN